MDLEKHVGLKEKLCWYYKISEISEGEGIWEIDNSITNRGDIIPLDIIYYLK